MSDNGHVSSTLQLEPVHFAERGGSLYQPVGSTGIVEYGGYILDEPNRLFQGTRWQRTIRSMLTHATIRGCLLAVELLIRRAEWTTEPAPDGGTEAQEVADFIESARQDMRDPWEDTLATLLSFLPYGYSLMEMVLKRRMGDEGAVSSASDDGLIGWAEWSPRAQDTVEKWVFDDFGHAVAVVQQVPTRGSAVTIPLSRCLHFRAGGYRGSPEGESLLKAAFEDWDALRKLQLIEAIGIERDLAGLPVALLPPQYLGQNRTPEQLAVFNAVKQIVTGVRQNDQAGVVFPLAYDDKGKETFQFKLLSTGGARAFDTSAVISRRTTQMTRAFLADFMTLGQAVTGSFALSKSKTDLFVTAIQSWLDMIADVINRQAIAPLIRLNGIDTRLMPTLHPGIPDEADLGGMGGYFTALWPMLQTLEREDQLDIVDHFLDVADLPMLTASREALEAGVVTPVIEEPTDTEVDESAVSTPVEVAT